MTFVASIVLALAVSFSGSCSSALAFMTYSWFGGAIHRDILRQALTPLGLGYQSLKTIGRGTDSQDILFSRKYASCPQNHCDDNQILEGREYWRGQIREAVALAQYADTDRKQRLKALYAFGEGMHTVQDFYSHANYLEWLLQNHQALKPIDWDNLPSGICTGYYYYDRPLAEEAFVSRARSVRGLHRKHGHLDFSAEAEYETRTKTNAYDAALTYALNRRDFLHKELNKDSPKTMEGRVVAPEYNKTFHQLARDLATADTARQWKNFEQLISEKYGSRAANIIVALKGQ